MGGEIKNFLVSLRISSRYVPFLSKIFLHMVYTDVDKPSDWLTGYGNFLSCHPEPGVQFVQVCIILDIVCSGPHLGLFL